ncbi:MAG TPA: cobalamin-independent methionine synthase II family protein [Vineibacter sp.]|nr:cobalamin-independent methionine synthase II family protein [Vineibacter sp.]
MQRSTDRILTTHVGSLPRSASLTDLLIRQERNELIDEAQLVRETEAAVADVVHRQIGAGVDIINDGEQPRVGFQTYVPQRMKGFGGASSRPMPTDYAEFPGFAKAMAARFTRRSKVRDAPQAVADVRYEDLTAAEQECALFEGASAGHAGQYVERFMTAASPGIIATTMLNAHYDSHEKYVFALAREMKKEYELIVARGFILQLDAPDLAMERVVLFQDKPLAEFLAVVELHIAAINAALADIPRDRVRLHCCWGNWEGPHVHDVPVGEILPLLYQARVGGLSLEFANPRHQHEYAELKRQKLPAEMVLLPGVLDSTTNYVEHPEVVANRICEAVDAVGDRTRVIASTDCGFGTFAGYEFVAADVVWAKLQAAAEGARIASNRLWG